MLIHPTGERLRSLGLVAMADALIELVLGPVKAKPLYGGCQEDTYMGATNESYSIAASSVVSFFVRPRPIWS